MEPTSPPPAGLLSRKDALLSCLRALRKDPLQAALLAGVIGVVVFFFALYPAFIEYSKSALAWAWESWNPENDMQHGVMIIPITLAMIFYHLPQFIAAPKKGSNAGLIFVIGAVILYFLSVRLQQPRYPLIGFPVLCYGMVLFLWGKQVARIALFPCLFLFFMVPLGFIISETVFLQTFAANVAVRLSGLLGIGVVSSGSTITALDGSFNFEVAGGCSGIRSLMAMMMLSALYVHFTQKRLLNKVLIFGFSLLFALIGNLARIFSVVLVAHYVSEETAGGLYHDYSDYVFFPIAVAAMVAFSGLLNRIEKSFTEPTETTPSKREVTKQKPSTPVSYDY